MEGRNTRAINEFEKRLRLYRSQGYPIFCASCTKLPEGLGRGLKNCGYTSTCGGPLAGKDFPDYQGPIPNDKKATICLICGHSQIVCQLAMNGKRALGLCAAHRSIFDNMTEQSQGDHGVVVKSDTSKFMIIKV